MIDTLALYKTHCIYNNNNNKLTYQVRLCDDKQRLDSWEDLVALMIIIISRS